MSDDNHSLTILGNVIPDQLEGSIFYDVTEFLEGVQYGLEVIRILLGQSFHVVTEPDIWFYLPDGLYKGRETVSMIVSSFLLSPAAERLAWGDLRLIILL